MRAQPIIALPLETVYRHLTPSTVSLLGFPILVTNIRNAIIAAQPTVVHNQLFGASLLRTQ